MHAVCCAMSLRVQRCMYHHEHVRIHVYRLMHVMFFGCFAAAGAFSRPMHGACA